MHTLCQRRLGAYKVVSCGVYDTFEAHAHSSRCASRGNSAGNSCERNIVVTQREEKFKSVLAGFIVWRRGEVEAKQRKGVV